MLLNFLFEKNWAHDFCSQIFAWIPCFLPFATFSRKSFDLQWCQTTKDSFGIFFEQCCVFINNCAMIMFLISFNSKNWAHDFCSQSLAWIPCFLPFATFSLKSFDLQWCHTTKDWFGNHFEQFCVLFITIFVTFIWFVIY